MSHGVVFVASCPCGAWCLRHDELERFEREHENCAELLELFADEPCGPFVDFVDLFGGLNDEHT